MHSFRQLVNKLYLLILIHIVDVYQFSGYMINIADDILRAFYQSTKQRGAASLFTILEGVVFIIPLIYLFSETNQQLMWLSFALAEAASILLTVITMQIIARHKKRKNFLMLDNAAETNVLDMTITNQVESALEASRKIKSFCSENDIDSRIGTILAVTNEELAVNAAKYAYKDKNQIDICLRILDDKLVLRFRDNGKFFNPTEYINDSGEEITGLSVVRKLTPDISYNRVLGFNVTVVAISRTPA